MFSTIVVGFDGSSGALDALVLGEMLASPETKLVVCCVHPPEGFGLQLSSTGDMSMREQAQQRLHAARLHADTRPRTEFVVRTALSTGAGLHDEVEAEEADLLVVGSSHRGPVGRTLAGSVTRQALHAAPCAVAVASSSLHLREEPHLEQIGVGFDGGPESRVALETAARLAADRHARLRIMTAVDVTAVAVGWASAWVVPQVRDDLRGLAESRLREELRAMPGGVEATMELLEGDAALELSRRSVELDLLVLGSRGYGPVRRALLGTVSQRVVEGAACPVIVLPRSARATASEPATRAAVAEGLA